MSTDSNKGIKFTEQLQSTAINIDPDLKKRANDFLKDAELPTTRNEAWKYTRLAKLNKVAFVQNEDTSLSRSFEIDREACRITFVNGNLATNLSDLKLPEGVNIVRLRGNQHEQFKLKTNPEELFGAINLSYLSDGIYIHVSKKVKVDQPIEIIHVLKGSDVISNFKTIIKAEEFSQVNIIQGFFAEDGASSCFMNNSLEIDVMDNAILSLDKIQDENKEAFHISNEMIDQQKDSTFTINTHTLNGGLVRNNLNIRVLGTNCSTNLFGTYLLNGRQHVDNHTVVDHKVPHCESNELYKGVMNDQSTGVFNGKVFVREDAQKINAFQSNANILLSDTASINSKPELEIYADDVKCSHGSTTGQLDEEAIYYLQTRGISKTSARNLLIRAFVEEVLENIANENVRQFTESRLNDRFNWAL